ncbi:MAG: hypothetical protein Q8S73_26535 [Deltaproteobacteria bacterium]|nr:hypothetical protein [Myxococcales bacterium]MDP3217693.1 hypothetical protein [Deltaproteobacteria bacterium]
MKFICVIALSDGTVPYVDETGRAHHGRAMGRAASGQPEAERVADTTYVRRAIGRRELAEVPSPDASEAATSLVDPAPEPEAPQASQASRVVTTDEPLVIQRGVAADPLVNRTERDQ